MKLYLSSYRVPTPKDLIDLVGKPAEQIKVALIPNAKDYYAKRARDFKNNELVEYFKNLGLHAEVVDLRDFEQKELKEKLINYDLIWAVGGNTFCLRYEMKRSGFENIIRELLESGIVYGGDSAGACVAGPTLKGVETSDVPEFAEAVIWEGLNLTDKIIIPHADNPWMQEELKPMLETYKDNPSAVVLNDNQAYVVDNQNTRVVTAQKVE